MSSMPMSSYLSQQSSSETGVGMLAERRRSDRTPLHVRVSLVAMCGSEIGGCESVDVSECGMHLHAPVSASLGVGERLELRVHPAREQTDLDRLSDQPIFGTVVRTTPSCGRADVLGLGIRFDQPLYL